MSDYFSKLEGFFARAEEEVAQQQSERTQRDGKRQKWESEHRLKGVPKDWRLLTDNGSVQSYSDGHGNVVYYRDGVPMTASEVFDELNRRYGS